MRRLIILVLTTLHSMGFAQEHARILEHSTTYVIHEDETAEIEEHYRIKILSEQGHGFSIYQEYFDKFRKLSDITIDIFDQNGKKIKRLRRNDGIEFGLSPSNEITDGTVLTIKPDYKQFPFVIEVNSKIRFNGFISFPHWVPRSQFHVAVSQSQLTVIRPASLKINFREENIKGKTETKENKVITKYQVSNLAHVDKKFRYQDFYNDQPKVLISPDKFKLGDAIGSNASWRDFGNWFLALNDKPYKLTKKTTDYIDYLDGTDQKKRIQHIYEYMQDKTRYVSIQLGIGGFKSLPTEDVENYGYGDCKALTTYMKNMLDYAGIKSNYVLVQAGTDVPEVIADFPSNQFNHVFLGIPFPKDTLYLECTSQIIPADYIGSFTDDRNVLWIENNESSIIRSRIYDHTDNTQDNIVNIDLDREGNAVAEFDIFNQGTFFDEIMLFKLAPSDYVKSHNQSKFIYNDFTIKSYTFNQPYRNSASFNSKYSLIINGLAKLVNDKLVLPIVPVTPFQKYIDKDDLMKFYAIKRGMTITDEIAVNLPQNYWIYSMPETEHVNSTYGSYKLATAFDGKTLRIKRTIVLYKGDYSKAAYEEFKVFYQKVEKLEKRKLVLNAKT